MGTSLRVDVLRFDKVERFDQHQVKPKSGCTPFHRSSHLSHTLWVFVGSTLDYQAFVFLIWRLTKSGSARIWNKFNPKLVVATNPGASLHVPGVDSPRHTLTGEESLRNPENSHPRQISFYMPVQVSIAYLQLDVANGCNLLYVHNELI